MPLEHHGRRAILSTKDMMRAVKRPPQTDPAVLAWLHDLGDPRKNEIDTVRQLVLDVSRDISEIIKWTAPTFRTTDDFLTFNLRAKGRIRLVFHTGAKVKAEMTISDPAGLLEWLGKDRAIISVGDRADIESKRAALQAIVREWIATLA